MNSFTLMRCIGLVIVLTLAVPGGVSLAGQRAAQTEADQGASESLPANEADSPAEETEGPPNPDAVAPSPSDDSPAPSPAPQGGAPRAAQIEPIVPPIKRVAPKIPATSAAPGQKPPPKTVVKKAAGIVGAKNQNAAKNKGP